MKRTSILFVVVVAMGLAVCLLGWGYGGGYGPSGSKQQGTQGLDNGVGITLTPNLASPQLVGQPIKWTATVAQPGQFVYRFSVRSPGAGQRIVRDFSLKNDFEHTPMREGRYEIIVAVKPDFSTPTTDGTQTQQATFDAASRVTDDSAVVSGTRNPLVALYSAPGCRGGTIRAEFRAKGSTAWKSTPAQKCGERRLSHQFIIAGMLASQTYEIRHVVSHGDDETASSPLDFTTGAIPRNLLFTKNTVFLPPASTSDSEASNLLVFPFPKAGQTTWVGAYSMDLAAHVNWYFDPTLEPRVGNLRSVSQDEGGNINQFGTDLTGFTIGYQVYREVDLANNTVRETNLDQVNAQLAALGQPQTAEIGWHEAQRLPGNRIAMPLVFQQYALLNGTQRLFESDLIAVLDKDLQVVWTWNPHDFLSVAHDPLSETCGNSHPAGCAVDPTAIDWIHMNALKIAPDGNLLVSMRAQDWVIKIAYENGTGDGHIIWRLGKDGDFTIDSTDPYPWFSHQHDARYLDDHTIAVWDNGNTRCGVVAPQNTAPPGCNSRAQVYAIDESTLTASLILNKELPFSYAMGSTQRLANGNYVFDDSFQFTNTNPAKSFAQVYELSPSGTPLYGLQLFGDSCYRGYRLVTLYEGSAPIGKGGAEAGDERDDDKEGDDR